MDENGLAELLAETRQKIRTANHAKCQLYSNIYQSVCSTPLEDILYDSRPEKTIREILEEYLLYGYGDPKSLAAIIFTNTEKKGTRTMRDWNEIKRSIEGRRERKEITNAIFSITTSKAAYDEEELMSKKRFRKRLAYLKNIWEKTTIYGSIPWMAVGTLTVYGINFLPSHAA